jgi:protein-S-isoprenylcysteine O-methyltransferase Ste14
MVRRRNPETTRMTEVAAQLPQRQRQRKMTLRVLAVLGVVVMTALAASWPVDGSMDAAIESTGMVLVLVCIAGRTWCSFYIGGHKIQELVTSGPYSVTRNPLYVFSTIGALGVGAMFGAIVFAVVAGVAVYAVFAALIRREEPVLATVHGEAFRAYCARVPRFWPRLSAWQDRDTLTIRMSAVYSTFFDSLFFLAAYPLAEGIEWLQETGWLHPLLLLP